MSGEPGPDRDLRPPRPHTRRRLLQLSGLTVAALAGCASDRSRTDASRSETGSSSRSPSAVDAPDDPAGLLAAGGVVAYLRPPGAREAHDESALVETDGCTGDSVLSTEARARARAMGDALAALGADVRDVATSRRCPARDTARLSVGGGTAHDALAESIARPPETGVRALVGSSGSPAAVADAGLAPGECAVLVPAGDDVTVRAVGDPTAWAAGASRPGERRWRYAVREGTPQETDVLVRRGGAGGPTVVVVGGIHGDETAGVRATAAIADRAPAAGTLVVVPRANVPAVERTTRTGPEGVDLNRQFPLGEPPATPLARALWNVVARHDPDLLVDLHSSQGIWGDGGFGQAVFYSGDDPLATRVGRIVEGVNEQVLPPERRPEYYYESVESDGDPPGMFATKVAADLDVPACVHEVTESGLAVETQVAWSQAVAARLLAASGLRQP